jgi:hypothetical protein
MSAHFSEPSLLMLDFCRIQLHLRGGCVRPPVPDGGLFKAFPRLKPRGADERNHAETINATIDEGRSDA